MQTHGFMELTCPASGGSRKKVAGNGQCFSVFLCPLAATDTVTVLAWRPPHMQFQIVERGRPGEADRDTAEGEVGFSGGQGGPEQIWCCTALRSGRHNRPSGLNVGSPPHNRHSPEGCRRSVHDPTRTFRFVFPNCRVGQKNYLFIGSEGAAKAAAIAYTLIETAKLNDVDPQAWLTDVLNPDFPDGLPI